MKLSTLAIERPKTAPPIVWKPLKGSQELALDTRAQQTLYTGTRGPGKSECQLARFRKNVGMGYGDQWRGIILDREYKNLDDLISKSKRFFRKFNDGAQFLSSNSSLKWVWPTGEELLFRVAKEVEDYWDYHGQEFPFIGWNELTKYPEGELYEMFMSCNRSSWTQEKDSKKRPDGSYLTPPIPLEVFSTTNPFGPGHGWVKQKFIDPVPYGKILRTEIKVFNPATQENITVQRTQVAIFGSYIENIYLDPLYIAGLHEVKDPNMRKAWLTGDWNIAAGGAFSALWRKDIHIKARFKVPSGWKLDRSFDWGSTHPYWVGWWAEANGETVQIRHSNGSLEDFTPQRGSIILFNEEYGTEKIHTNKGTGAAPSEISMIIRDEEESMREDGWISTRVRPGPADNQIRNVIRKDQETIERTMAACGVRWTHSDKSQGSRPMGFQAMIQRLYNSVKGEGAGIYWMDNCVASIAIIPNLPRDPKKPDDTDEKAEDHPWDGTRYRILAAPNRTVTKLNVTQARARK